MKTVMKMREIKSVVRMGEIKTPVARERADSAEDV